MEWQPSEELIAWGNEHFGKLSIDGIWSPDDSGVQYRKLSDNKFALMFMLNHPLAQEHHEKFTILMKACGYEIEEPDGIEMVTPPLDPMAHAEMQYNQKREIAQSWVCNCGFPLANNDLSVSKYEYVETVDAQTNDGGTVPIDLWRVMVSCISCGDDISTDPDDFHLLAGDDLFMSWQSNTNRYIALTREQMKDFADSGVFDDGFGSSNITVLGKMRGDERVPPWLWGIPCLITEAVSEEE
jgi:hypothetical protein